MIIFSTEPDEQHEIKALRTQAETQFSTGTGGSCIEVLIKPLWILRRSKLFIYHLSVLKSLILRQTIILILLGVGQRKFVDVNKAQLHEI